MKLILEVITLIAMSLLASYLIPLILIFFLGLPAGLLLSIIILLIAGRGFEPRLLGL